MTAVAKKSIEECYKKMAWAIHELSNCIIVIRGESLFLQEEQCLIATPDRLTALKSILHMTEQACKILHEARMMHPVEDARMEIKSVVALMLLFKEELELSGLKVDKINLDSNIETAQVSYITEEIERVLMNVTSNARNAGATQVNLTARAVNGCIAISVFDNGCGVSRQKLALMGSRYVNDKGEEHGSGLKIIRDACYAMNATATWDSIEDLGTKFSIYFHSVIKDCA